jgi:glycosyltransferase involved in cell wall biosynthesis
VFRTAPLSIGFVLSSFEPGGTERQMAELMCRLDPLRWAVHVACLRAEGECFGRVAEAARSVTAFPIRSFKSPETTRRMYAFARWCRDLNLAIVHTTDMPTNIFALAPAAIARVPIRVANRREINAGKSMALIAMQRVAYSAAHKVVANSRAAAARLLREQVPVRKIAVVPNGLDANRFVLPPRRSPRRKIVVVAYLRREKGHDVLIDSAPAVLRRFPDASFEFVGDGAEREALISRARDRGVLDRITFAGHAEDVPQRLAGADIFVLPSRSEAFPNAVLEAMASGLPIVATGVGGICELIEHERNGLLVAPGDHQTLAAQICRLMDDEALARRLSQSARAHVHARYSFDRMVAQFEELYLNALRRSRRLAACVVQEDEPDAPILQPSEHA